MINWLREIRVAVGLDDRTFAGGAFHGVAVFHAHDSLEVLRLQVLEDFTVVDLAGAGLFAAGVVTTLEIRDFIPGVIDVGDEISFGDLLMIDVKEDLAGRAIDRATNRVGLIGFLQPSATVVGVFIERFEDHHEVVRFEDFGAAAEHVDNVGKLVTGGEAGTAVAIPVLGLIGLLIDRTRDDRHPLGVAPARNVDGLADLGENLLMGGVVAVGKGGGIETAVGHKNAHLHVAIGESFADGLLFLGRTFGHAVVFPGGEPLVGGELDLINYAVSREGFEHAGVRGVTEVKLRQRGGGALAEKARLAGEQCGAGDEGGIEESATIHRAEWVREN